MSTHARRIGVDFDNTVICYDGMFHRAAVDKGLIPESVGRAKNEVRDYLRAQDREQEWTELQGHVYGERVTECRPYPGALEFFTACVQQGVEVFVVSHKTRHPYIGPKHDLHAAARGWIDFVGLLDTGLSERNVYFELTKAEKLERIAALGCTHFIDDLPEFLAEPGFPQGVERILFDPHALHTTEMRFQRVTDWRELIEQLASGAVNA